MKKQISDALPLLEVADGTIISKAGDYTAVFEVEKPELFTHKEEDYEQMQDALTRVLENFDSNTIIHMQDWYLRRNFNPGIHPTPPHLPAASVSQEDFITTASNRHFLERPCLHHRCLLYFTRLPKEQSDARGQRYSRSIIAGTLKPQLAPDLPLSQSAASEFEEEVNRAASLLSASKHFRLRRLSATEIAGTSSTTGIIEQYLTLNDPAATPSLTDLQSRGGLTIGGRDCCFYTMADPATLPAQCSSTGAYLPFSTETNRYPIGFATPLGPLLDTDHIVNLFVYLPEPTTTRRRLERKGRRHRSLANHSRNNALAASAIDSYLNEAVSGQHRLVKTHVNVMAWTEEDTLPLQTRISAAFAALGASPHLETVSAMRLFWAGIPGNAGELPIYEMTDMYARQAACFQIPETLAQDAPGLRGIRFGDRTSGLPLNVDLTDEPMRRHIIGNRNKFILGPSGSGKSFFTNHLVHTAHQQGAHVCIIDQGGSYKGLCELLGGYYFTYDEQTPMQFNPFWMPNGQMPDTEKCESIKSLLMALWKKESESNQRSEYVALSNSLKSWYSWLATQPDSFACFNSYYDYMQEQYSAILAAEGAREKDFDIRNFLYVLRPFYKGGEYELLLNAQTQLDLLDQRFIVFELDNIRDHPILFTAATIIIMDVFMAKVRNLPAARKLIIIEEAWKAIARSDMGEFIKYAFKTLRKFNGEAILVTQDVDDILSSPIVREAIINNADTRILLDQRKFAHRFDAIGDLLGLTARERAMALSLNKGLAPDARYKEVFISMGSNYSRVYRLEVSLEEQLAYTTEPTQKLLVAEYAGKYGSIRRGIQVLAASIRDGSVKFGLLFLLCLSSVFLPGHKAKAQIPIAGIIQAAVKKVIVATDLEIQRYQTQTILLQQAEKLLENQLQHTRLGDIAGWVQRQEDLFDEYYRELWSVKPALAAYSGIETARLQQQQFASAYESSVAAVSADPHFSTAERSYIGSICQGMLAGTADDMAQLQETLTDSTLQLTDGERLRRIDDIGQRLERNCRRMQELAQESALLSAQRSRDQRDLDFVRSLYGLHQ